MLKYKKLPTLWLLYNIWRKNYSCNQKIVSLRINRWWVMWMIRGLLVKQLWTFFVIIWIRYFFLNFWLWTHFMRVSFHRVQTCSILLNCSIYESGLNNLKTKKTIRINWSLIWFNLSLIHTKHNMGHWYIVIKNNNQYKNTYIIVNISITSSGLGLSRGLKSMRRF